MKTPAERGAILAIPFDERLLELGVHRAPAVHLFQAGQATLAQAARLAELSVERFLEVLAEAGVPAVSYPRTPANLIVQCVAGGSEEPLPWRLRGKG